MCVLSIKVPIRKKSGNILMIFVEVHSSVFWVGRKTKDLVVYVKVNWHPNVWVQSSSELTSTLFVCLSENRSLDRDLFCGVSSDRLPSAIRILHRTMTEISISSGQSWICHNALKNGLLSWDNYLCNVTVPIVIGAFGTIAKGLFKGLGDLEVGGRVETIQMTALLRTARILRRVLETWGDLLSLKLHWKTIS